LRKVSISFRLTIWFTTVFLCGFVILGIAMWLGWSYTLSSGRDRTLSRRAARALDVLSNFSGQPVALRSARFDEFVDATPEGNLIEIFDSGGRMVYPKDPLAPRDFPWPRRNRSAFDTFQNLMYRGREYRALQHPARVGAEQLVIVVSGQLEDNRLMLSRFATGLIETIPLLLAGTALAGYFMSRRALQPLGQLTAAVRSLSIGNLAERLPIEQTGDELQRLAETCNDMLARLETAVAQIKRFTADASHELRSPLSYICMMSECALRRPDLPEECREWFEDILGESQDASHLLEDMLLLARADAGHVDIPFERTDLVPLVEDALERARIPAENKGHRLRLQCVDGPFEVRGDRTSLRRLIWTLLDNAIKYTPEGGRVEILLEGNDTQVRLHVRDTGVGIPAHLLPRVFERFFRADPARSQTGTGLGLAIAKWIADVHQADLAVESEPGAGAVFTVAFPAQSSGSLKVGMM
jgi:two-component system, OmpR family, heavy metal sensor histidine kinase CusS